MRDLVPGDLNEIQRLLRRSNESPYDASRVAMEKCFGEGASGPPRARGIVDGGELRGMVVTCGAAIRLIAVDRGMRRRGLGTMLLNDAVASIVGAEAGNYFTPGIVDADRGTIRFFESHGFRQTTETHNLEVVLDRTPASGAAIRVTLQDKERVLAFIGSHFGRIWRFEAARAFDNDPPTMFVVEVDGTIAGFSAHEANNRGLASFGPTGVAESHRGRGLGRELLLASLADLRRLGYTRATIPWTDAIEFYRKSCGAEPAHRFVILRK